METLIGWIKPLIPPGAATADVISTISAFIAFLSLVVAAGSVIYSRWAVKEAKRANSISMHQFERTLYEAYERLMMKISEVSLVRDDVSAFQLHANLAEVYLPELLAIEVDFFNDSCWEAVEAFERLGRAKDSLDTMPPSPSDRELNPSRDEVEKLVRRSAEEWQEALLRALRQGSDLGDSLRENMRLMK